MDLLYLLDGVGLIGWIRLLDFIYSSRNGLCGELASVDET